MYEADFQARDLLKARKLADEMKTLFWDEVDGGFYFAGRDAEQLISREKEIADGAMPSGNSVAAYALARLSSLSGETYYHEIVEDMYRSFYEEVHERPAASTFLMAAVMQTGHPTKEVVALGDEKDPGYVKFVDGVKRAFLPEVALLAASETDSLLKAAPFTADYHRLGDRTTIYICENFTCQAHTQDVDAALHHLLTDK